MKKKLNNSLNCMEVFNNQYNEGMDRSFNQISVPIEDLYALNPLAIWKAFASESFAFWMSCMYVFFEYVRPHAILPWLDFYPYWARTFIILAFLGWFFDSQKKFVWSKITTGIFLFQAVIILSSMNAYWPEISWDKFMVLFNWVVIFFVLTQTVTTRKRFFIILLIFFAASFKLSFFCAKVFAMRGFSFASWGLSGPPGFFQNPGELAIQMVIFAPMSLFFIIGIKPYLSKWKIRLLLLMPLTAALTVVGANTRGSQLALLAQIVVLVAMTRHRIKTFILAFLILVIGFQILPDEQKARFERMGQDGTSIQRLLYWKHGWQMIKDHPLLGVGYFNFPMYYKTFHAEDITLDILQGQKAQLSHNIFIQVGTDSGFSGLIIFVYLLLAGCFQMKIIRRKACNDKDKFVENIALGLNLALLGYVIAAQFVTVAYYPFIWVHLFFVTSLCVLYRQDVIIEN